MSERLLLPSRVPPIVRLLLAMLLFSMVSTAVVMCGERSGLWPANGGALGQAVVAAAGALTLVAFAYAVPPPGELSTGLMAKCYAPLPFGPLALPFRSLLRVTLLRSYLPFAIGWCAFTLCYLKAMCMSGHPVAMQPMLLLLKTEGLTEETLALALASVVAAPIAEELLFRGYLLGALLPFLPTWLAYCITAAAFGFAHGPDYALPIALLGLYFGWLRQRYAALLPSVLAHAVHNGLMVCIALLLPRALDLLYCR
ncbi:hypothetical protein LBMAG49_17640 [Planctomycetota bacterium]|jgi:membrane protease YdiL (CAAX protease family)|nr:hypothetical protein LBMAG49_17640 [Planctomycetota bacterium]